MNKKVIYKQIRPSLLFFIFLIIFVFLNSTIVISSTIVSINPVSQSVTTYEDFDVDVYCTPDEPVKAYEFKLLFNASLIQANSVTEGDIFNGYSTFYNSGIINNSEGSIINVFGLIIGQDNITDPGTLVTISCTAKSDIGLSNLSLYDVGITNETSYITILINNGSIIINYPYIAHIFSAESPTNNSEDIPFSTSNLSISINNTEGHPFYWEITTSPSIGSNSGTNAYNGTKICNISSLSYSTTYTWYVKCKDLINSNWTNKSYLFTTLEDNNSPPGGGGGVVFIPPITQEVVNNPPNQPLKPAGPKFIEKDVLYEYTSSSFDVDGDKIRYRFDWGDGTFSNWSDYILSNVTVSMLHSWNSISVYEIKVIAQDQDGLNSSWSDLFRVVVSQANISRGEPVAEISILNDSFVSNQTIVFGASNSYDLDGAIISYNWDFGDGEYGTGINCAHIYKSPGEYIVTLSVMDNEGNTNSYSTKVNIADKSVITSLGKSKTVFGPGINTIFVMGIMVLILSIFIIVFRDKIQIKLLNSKINKIRKLRDKYRYR